MGQTTTSLITQLDELSNFLIASGDSHWSAWMLESRDLLLSSDYSGIEHLLGAYGGMGSFNDLFLEEKGDSLRSSVWQLAQEIKREHELPGA